MREVKFKAYIKHLNIIVPVLVIDFQNEEIEVDLSGGQGDVSYYRFNEVELMEFAGQVDEKGTNIYEGYKVQNKKGEWEGVVVFIDGAFKVVRLIEGKPKYWVLERQRAEKIEVIGNIYEDPE